jgi:UDP-N-acetylmuramoylalanine--D-glutamate ligase
MSHYAAAKGNILLHQERSDVAVLGADDGYTGPWLASGRVHIAPGEGQEEVYFPLQAATQGFSLRREVPVGSFLSGERLMLRQPGRGDVMICSTADVRLRGRHNLANILAAACLTSAGGAPLEAIAGVATSFGGVEHRLEIVRERAGVTWVNDSIATAPERTIAAIRSFADPLVLLLGGRDKHLPWDECAREICSSRVRHVVLFGEAAGLIADAIAKQGEGPRQERVPDLPAAVRSAERVAQAGDIVLLAPGGTSFDAYADFAARGHHFRELVEALP